MLAIYRLFWSLFFITFILMFKSIRIQCDFCSDYKTLSDGSNQGIDELKFVVTKDKLYIFLYNSESRQSLYELDYNCIDCPRIGSAQQLSQVFENVSNLNQAFIQDGLTYIFHKRSDGSELISVFDNRFKIREMPANEVWKNVSHSTVYEWKNNRRNVISRFIPPKSRSDRIHSHSIALTHDSYNGVYSVELIGDFDGIAFLQNGFYYQFGQYLVPYEFISYLPLPNGDAIFNKKRNAKFKRPAYIRNEGVEIHLYESQNVEKLFGCDKTTIKKTLKDPPPRPNLYYRPIN